LKGFVFLLQCRSVAGQRGAYAVHTHANLWMFFTGTDGRQALGNLDPRQ